MTRVGVAISVVSARKNRLIPLTATVIDSDNIRLDWVNLSNDIDGTKIYYRTGGVGEFTILDVVVGSENTYTMNI